MSILYGQRPGFARDARRGAKEVGFQPTPWQIEKACKRIKAVMHKHHGMIPFTGEDEAISFFCREVFNRGRQLGDPRRNEFRTTISQAYAHLVDGDKPVLYWCDRGLGCSEKPPRRRQHKQKYPTRGSRQLRAA